MLNYVLECDIRKNQESKVRLELNMTHQLSVYAVYINLLGGNINIIKDTEALLDASKQVGLQENTKKTKYMFMSHHQTTGKNHYIKVANKSFKKCGKVQIFWNDVTLELDSQGN
jgi:hypothetical protein